VKGATMPSKKIAVFSIMQNEDIFSRIWVNHYSKLVPTSDIFILNHNTSTEKAMKHLEDFKLEGVNVININNSVSFDHEWLRDTVKDYQKKLLESYEVVIFAEADEYIVVDPSKTNLSLSEYIFEFFKDGVKNTIRCTGYCVDHVITLEPPLDLSRPILAQRSRWRRTLMFDKPLISNQPCDWHIGFHWIEGKENSHTPDRNVLLLHLHKMDYYLCLQKHAESSRRNWSEKDISERIGEHNYISGDVDLYKWFVSGSKFQKTGNELIKYPDYIKNIDLRYS
jgi:hypothetical protein